MSCFSKVALWPQKAQTVQNDRFTSAVASIAAIANTLQAMVVAFWVTSDRQGQSLAST